MVKNLLWSVLLSLFAVGASANPLMMVVSKSEKTITGNININALQSGTIELVGPVGPISLIKTMQLGPTWVGEAEGFPGSSVTFTKHKGVVTGYIVYSDVILELVPSGAGHVINIISDTDMPQGVDPTLDPLDPADYVMAAASEAGTIEADAYQHDILIYYTSNVLTHYGSTATAESAILNTVAMANQGYVNSGVNIRLNVVFIGPTTYVDTGDGQLDLNNLRGTTDGYMDEVHTLRNQVGADLVHLITNSAAGLCGIGERPGSFALTVRSCMGGHTFAHEVGHNQGNGHNREDATGYVYPYSYGWRVCNLTDGTGFRTVMSYSCSNAPRVNIFSSPLITYNGYPAGVDYELSPTTAADNVRSMNNYAPTIAARRTPPGQIVAPSAPTGLTASSTSSDKVTLRWTDTATSEDGFVVERSLDQTTWTVAATVGANTSAFTDGGRTALTTYYYRVKAYNALYTSEYSNIASATTTAIKRKGKPTR
jgi:peptidyl-Asp metalloendopeptidase